MEKKFGIFQTVEELNRAAAAQKAEGDLEALIALAEENGLDREDAEHYYDAPGGELCTPYMAAIGKLDMEEKELGLKSQLKDWKDFVVQQILEEDTLGDLSRAVFSPEKHLLDVMAAGLRKASENRITVDKRITKAAGLPDSAAQIGMVGRNELRKIVLDYYRGGEQ
jgi:hypothetical protein